MFVAKNNEAGVAATDTLPWAAPVALKPVHAKVALPGSKSLTNRELILAALAEQAAVAAAEHPAAGTLSVAPIVKPAAATTLTHLPAAAATLGSIPAAAANTLVAPLRSRDSDLMLAALESLGVRFNSTNVNGVEQLRVTPPAELSAQGAINCGLAGTVMRFMPAVAALALGPSYFDGDPYARKRPMQPLLTALRTLGADISDDERGTLPFTVHGFGGLRGGRVELDATFSSQFVSGLLLAAPRFADGVHVVHTGERLPSIPHIEMTLTALQKRGVRAYSPAPGEWVVEPGSIAPRSVVIEPDLSNAAPFLAAALVTGGAVTVPLWPTQTTQVGDQLRRILPAFGATVQLDGNNLKVTGPANGVLRGVTLNIPEAGELAPVLVGLATLATEPSKITGIGHIRYHETNRIQALVHEINNLGGKATELPDGIAITPAPLTGGLWRTYADHRMATTGALIGLRVPGVIIDDIACTAKTMPSFVSLWMQLLEQA